MSAEVYVCSKCGDDLACERVIEVTGVGNPWAGSVNKLIIRHTCPCAPGREIMAHYSPSPALLRRLLPGFTGLPYRSPFNHREVPEDDPLMVRWRWELEQLRDVEEFLLFCGGE